MRSTKKTEKIYSLTVDSREILSVEVETVPGLPKPKVPRKWLKGLIKKRWCQHRASRSQEAIPEKVH
jgi:hypothetical protein